MSNNGQPLDEVAVVAFAHMYHVHIAIIMDGHFWTSCRDHDIKLCQIYLGWQGQLHFVDIKQKEQTKVSVYNLRKPRYQTMNLDLHTSPKPQLVPKDPEPGESDPNIPVDPAPGPNRYELHSKNPPSNPPAAKPEAVPKPDRTSKPASDGKVVGTISFHTVGICKHLKKLKNLKCQICWSYLPFS